MISVGIVGATGYTGFELMRLLSAHPRVDLAVATSSANKGRAVSALFPGLHAPAGLSFEPHDSPGLRACDLVFFATPNATAMYHAPGLLKAGCRIIRPFGRFQASGYCGLGEVVWRDACLPGPGQTGRVRLAGTQSGADQGGRLDRQSGVLSDRHAAGPVARVKTGSDQSPRYYCRCEIRRQRGRQKGRACHPVCRGRRIISGL